MHNTAAFDEERKERENQANLERFGIPASPAFRSRRRSLLQSKTLSLVSDVTPVLGYSVI